MYQKNQSYQSSWTWNLRATLRMFSFFSKTLRKSQEKKLERKSSLRRKDSTLSVPSIDFAFNAKQQQSQSQLMRTGTEELYMNNCMVESEVIVSGQQQTAKVGSASSSSYRHVGKSSGNEFGCMADTFKSNKKCARSRSNVSLASLGSGYYTTGRANPDCKTNNLGIP